MQHEGGTVAKDVRSRTVVSVLILTFVLPFSSIFLDGQVEGKGKLFGMIKGKDIVSSIEGAVVKLRNISTGAVYEGEVDILGTFKIEGIFEGMYAVGLSTLEGDFSSDNLLEVKADETEIASFTLTPQFQLVQTELGAGLTGKGSLTGIIYEKDGVTPVVGALVVMRNLFTGIIFESGRSDSLGIFEIEGIDEGLYSGGIVTAKGNFNVENFIGIKANEKAKVTFILRPDIAGEVKKAELKMATIEVMRRGPKKAKFFSSAAGIATIVATSAAVTFGIIKLVEKEKEVSPFK